MMYALGAELPRAASNSPGVQRLLFPSPDAPAAAADWVRHAALRLSGAVGIATSRNARPTTLHRSVFGLLGCGSFLVVDSLRWE